MLCFGYHFARESSRSGGYLSLHYLGQFYGSGRSCRKLRYWFVQPARALRPGMPLLQGSELRSTILPPGHGFSKIMTIYNENSSSSFFISDEANTGVRFAGSTSQLPITWQIVSNYFMKPGAVHRLLITLHSKIDFNLHIYFSVNRYNQFGFIRRTYKQFNSIGTLRILYLTLIKSVLMYCSIV